MCSLMRSRLASMPTTQLLVKLSATSPSSRIDCSMAYASTGLNTLSSRWPWLPAKLTVVWLPITCAQTMVTASHWVGFTLPGMIDEPGSFSGSNSSPKPERGPDPSNRMSLAILNIAVATVESAPCVNTNASLAASASNLFSALTKGSFVIWAIFAAKASANNGCLLYTSDAADDLL